MRRKKFWLNSVEVGLSRDLNDVEMSNTKGTQVSFDRLTSAKSGLKFLIKIKGFRETVVTPFSDVFFFTVSLEKIYLHCQKKGGI